jgi:hypothetical protein
MVGGIVAGLHEHGGEVGLRVAVHGSEMTNVQKGTER